MPDIETIKTQLASEGHDVEEYALEDIGDQGEVDNHG